MIKSYFNKFKQSNFLLIYSIVISASLTIALGIHMNNVLDKALENSIHTQIANSNLANIRFYDEVLTNSTLLAATTGNLKWEKQYRLFEPKLDQAIKKVMELDSEGIFRQKLELINQANIQLAAMENQVFELARNKKQNEAIALINSQAYKEQKAIYITGLSEFVKLHELETDQQQIKLQQEVNLSKWYFGFLTLILLIIWLPVEHFLRKNRKKINQKNLALEYEIINRIAIEKSLQESKKQLKLSNRQLNLLLESAPAMIYTCQAFGNFDVTSISENIKERLGYDPKTFMEIPGFWEMNIHPDDKERIFLGINALFENGEHHHQYRFKHENGTWRWMSDSLKLVNDENGNPKEIIGYWQDITDWKLAEEAIKNSENKFKTLFDSANDAIFMMNEKTIIDCNSQTEKMFGCSKNDIIGNTPIKFSPEIQPIGSLSADLAVEKITAALNGEPQFFEWKHSRLDGSLFDTEVSLNKITLANKDYIQAIVRDISRRKQADEKIKLFAHAIKSSRDSICITDTDNNIQFVNKAMLKMYGYTKSELLGNQIEILHPLKSPKGLTDEITKVINKDGTWQNEIINKKKDGTEFPIFLSASPVQDEHGKIISFVGIARDITEQKQREAQILNLNATLEQKVEERTKQLALINDNLTKEIAERKLAETELINAKAELEQAIATKSEFFSRVSHELRTPLNGILGFAQLLEMSELAPIHKKGVNQILKSGKQLVSLVNEVLELSKPDTNEFTVSLEPIYLNGIILETAAISQPFANENNITIETENLKEENIYALADYQKLTQVLLNIINNAIKYNKKGGLVTIKATKIKNQKIRISITDTGEGIPTEEFSKLFMPFMRIGTEISEMEGTGLGLAVSKKLTEAMKGTIGAESEVGKGSTFWIELLEAEGQLDKHERETVFGVSPTNGNNKARTLLYIENNISNQKLVKQIIDTKRPKIKLINYLYGKDTVKLALDYKPDVILLDLDLPDIHGSEVLELLQKEPKTKEIPVIILSADDKDKQIKKLLKSGAKAYLTKPLDLQEFLRKLDEIMNDE